MGENKLQIMQFVPSSTGQGNIFARMQRYSFIHTHVLGIDMGSHVFFGEASIKIVTSKFQKSIMEEHLTSCKEET